MVFFLLVKLAGEIGDVRLWGAGLLCGDAGDASCLGRGEFRGHRPQAAGGGGGKRDPPDGLVPGGYELDPGHAGVGEFCCATRFSGILRLVSTSFRPNFPPSRVNRNLAKIPIHLSFFHSFWPFSASFFGRLDFWLLPFRLGLSALC